MTFSKDGPHAQVQGRHRTIVILAGTLLTLLASAFAGLGLPPAPLADRLLYDTLAAWDKDAEVDDRVAIVDIDDDSLAALGQWPWPRYRIAALVRKVAAAQPAAIGLDILFAEQDSSSLATMRERFRREFGLEIDFAGIPPGLEDNDGYLGHVLSKTPAVGSIYFTFSEAASVAACALQPLNAAGEIHRLNLHHAEGVMCNVEPIQQGLTAAGFINNLPDPDGRLRKLPLLIEHDGGTYPGFPLAMLMLHEGVDALSIEQDFYGSRLQVGGLDIPVTDQGYALLRFHGPARTVPSYSALSLIQGADAAEALRGRLVIIGSSAAGLNDLHHTITDPQMSGTETHATFISNALTDKLRRLPSWGDLYHGFATLTVGLVTTALFACMAPMLAALGASLTALFFFSVSAALFQLEHVFLSAVGPVLLAFTLLMVLSTILYILENQRSLDRLRRLVSAQRQTLSSMAAVAEMRDPYTGGHISRTQQYVRLLAEQLRRAGKHDVTQEYVDLLFLSAPLHDVGKVSMPDDILLKPGRLTEEEFGLMKKHAEKGRDILESAGADGEDGGFLNLAKEIAMTHHERWDGSGYPHGLRGAEIPLSGRLMALADVYDALVSSRLYKKPYTHEEARAIIIEGSGSHFDPDVVEAFLACETEFIRVATGSGNGSIKA